MEEAEPLELDAAVMPVEEATEEEEEEAPAASPVDDESVPEAEPAVLDDGASLITTELPGASGNRDSTHNSATQACVSDQASAFCLSVAWAVFCSP